jgi:hypothetical protein
MAEAPGLGEGLGAKDERSPMSLLDIDAHGRVVARSDEARRALADRAGRFVLLPSAADLLLARRTPPAGGAATRPRIILAGDLSGFPIADFVAFIHQSRLSGVLTVATGTVERAIAFQDGEVRSARSSAPGERIGEVAMRLGFVTEAQLTQAVAGGRPLGKELVDRGVLSANDLWKCFHEQVTAVFHAVLLARDGIFLLVDEDVADRPGAPLAVSTQSLLMNGIRRIDEMSLFRARVPGPGAYLRRRDPKRPITLKPVESAILELVDGRRTVAEIATASHHSEFDATKILYHLAEAGYVEALAEAAAAALADPAARQAAIAEGVNGLLRTVTEAIRPDARAAFLANVRPFLSDTAAPYAPLWLHVAPAPDGAIDPGPVLVNLSQLRGATLTRLEPSGDPGRLFFDALRELLFFYLYLAGERLPRDEDERLAAAVKDRLAGLEALRS